MTLLPYERRRMQRMRWEEAAGRLLEDAMAVTATMTMMTMMSTMPTWTRNA